MFRRLSVGVGLLLFVSSCGSNEATTPSTPSLPAAPTLALETSASAQLRRLAQAPWEIEYTLCTSVQSVSPELSGMAIRRAEYTLLDDAGQPYRAWPDPQLVGVRLAARAGRCMDVADTNVNRPVPPSFRMVVEYGADVSAATSTRTLSGSVKSTVPPLPFITGATLTEDIADGQNIVRQLGPITFTVTSVQGGTAPFLYQYKINGFLLRDWDTNPAFVWPGTTLNGQPLGSGGLTTTVNIRRSTWPETEWGTSVSFIVSLPLK